MAIRAKMILCAEKNSDAEDCAVRIGLDGNSRQLSTDGQLTEVEPLQLAFCVLYRLQPQLHFRPG